jgi:hypothetical protein
MLVFYGSIEVLHGSGAHPHRGGAVNGLEYPAVGAQARAGGFTMASIPA